MYFGGWIWRKYFLFTLWCFLISRLNSKITLDYNFIRVPLIFIVAILHNAASGSCIFI